MCPSPVCSRKAVCKWIIDSTIRAEDDALQDLEAPPTTFSLAVAPCDSFLFQQNGGDPRPPCKGEDSACFNTLRPIDVPLVFGVCRLVE